VGVDRGIPFFHTFSPFTQYPVRPPLYPELAFSNCEQLKTLKWFQINLYQYSNYFFPEETKEVSSDDDEETLTLCIPSFFTAYLFDELPLFEINIHGIKTYNFAIQS
jgi:hypothetical protein